MRIKPFSHAPSGAVVFGPGVAAQVGAQGILKKCARVLLVTDSGVSKAGALDAARASLGDRIHLVDDQVVPDGDVAHINDVARRARDTGIDGILAVGGGSVMDSAKGVGAVLAKGKPLEELEGIATIRTKLPPLACVPTTSGTGSEATQFMVIKDRAERRKRIYMDASLVPAQAFLDPTLLLGLPRAITAATGVDAITHAVEAAASQMRNPVASALAAEAVRRLVGDETTPGALARALDKPDDIDARGSCLVAANLAGQAISSAMLGACHAFAHALGAHKGVPHGVANGVFLVPVMRANLEKARRAYALLGAVLGVPGDDAARAAGFIERIEKTVHGVAAIPTRLSALGVTEADVADLVRLTMGDSDLATNPVPFDEESVRALITARL